MIVENINSLLPSLFHSLITIYHRVNREKDYNGCVWIELIFAETEN